MRYVRRVSQAGETQAKYMIAKYNMFGKQLKKTDLYT